MRCEMKYFDIFCLCVGESVIVENGSFCFYEYFFEIRDWLYVVSDYFGMVDFDWFKVGNRRNNYNEWGI